jgi:hypothetical protein
MKRSRRPKKTDLFFLQILFIIVAVNIKNKGVRYDVIKPPKPVAYINIK